MKLNKLNFRPLPGISSCHLQTIIPAYLPGGDAPPSIEWLVDLEHDDFSSRQVSTPIRWKESDPTVILVHGLGGSHESSYMVRMANKLHLRGTKVVRVNLRNCGSGKGLSKLLYHGGNSKDLLKVVHHMKESRPRVRNNRYWRFSRWQYYTKISWRTWYRSYQTGEGFHCCLCSLRSG